MVTPMLLTPKQTEKIVGKVLRAYRRGAKGYPRDAMCAALVTAGLIEAVEALGIIAGGDGDAQMIARQTLTKIMEG